MNQFQVSLPEKFTFKADDWLKWIKRFERFRIASGLETQEDENQVNALIYVMGEEAEDILTSMHLSPEDAADYEVVKQRLNDHFIARRNVIFERAKFNQRQQAVGESVDHFIMELHCLAEHCGYGELHDEMVRDRLVVGLTDKRLSEQLQLDPELTLEKAVVQVRQIEQVKKQQELLKSNFKGEIVNEQLDSVQAKQYNNVKSKQLKPHYVQFAKKPPHEKYKKGIQCSRCGDTRAHNLQLCPARDAICNLCHKKGHYAKMCKSKKVHEVNIATLTEDADEDIAFLGSVTTNVAGSPWMTEIKIDNLDVVFKIDTGADFTVVPVTLYNQGQFNKLKHAGKILQGPGGTSLNEKGKFTATLSKKNKCTKQDV